MIALVQRVREASVTVENTTIGAIDRDCWYFWGFTQTTPQQKRIG